MAARHDVYTCCDVTISSRSSNESFDGATMYVNTTLDCEQLGDLVAA